MRKIFTLLLFLCVLFSGVSLMAQIRIITGKIISEEDGGPLPGARIKIKGSTKGTSTNGNGNFSIEVPDANAILTISLVGYKSKEIPVGTQATVNVSLVSDSQ